jgi:hypothetical protein
MPENEQGPGRDVETDIIADELAAIPHEPLLPIEKKLIVWSLALGFLLLALLVWVSSTFFPVVADTK